MSLAQYDGGLVSVEPFRHAVNSQFVHSTSSTRTHQVSSHRREQNLMKPMMVQPAGSINGRQHRAIASRNKDAGDHLHSSRVERVQAALEGDVQAHAAVPDDALQPLQILCRTARSAPSATLDWLLANAMHDAMAVKCRDRQGGRKQQQ